MRRKKPLLVENKEECPLCKNKEFIKIGARCMNGSAGITIGGRSGSLLLGCTKCGCVCLSKADLERREE